ncbi:hypothetical protein HMPREF9597_01015 [Cutibacterium acnes HL005PA4]|nr:hypothetical protein HMPREF9612_01326 [Cutibacterium acnes HL063PA2]EFS79753.1 hypothetical protein HMPREF9597_01015 [Cutibacterium acnes HL005PA4]
MACVRPAIPAPMTATDKGCRCDVAGCDNADMCSPRRRCQ